MSQTIGEIVASVNVVFVKVVNENAAFWGWGPQAIVDGDAFDRATADFVVQGHLGTSFNGTLETRAEAWESLVIVFVDFDDEGLYAKLAEGLWYVGTRPYSKVAVVGEKGCPVRVVVGVAVAEDCQS